jgi:hypothetical protein
MKRKVLKAITSKLHVFLHRIRWPKLVTNQQLMEVTQQKEIVTRVKRQKWSYIRVRVCSTWPRKRSVIMHKEAEDKLDRLQHDGGQ